MADPLSVTASIIAVIQITSSVVSICYDYRSGTKHASKEMKQLTDEVISMRDVLERLLTLTDQDDPEETQLPTLKLLTNSDGPLSRCKDEMTLLEAELKPATGLKAVGRTLKWPLTRSGVENRVAKLSRLKTTFMLALAVDHTSVALAIQSNTDKINRRTEIMANDLGSFYKRREYEETEAFLAAPDPSANHLAARRVRDPSSGTWLMKDYRYSTWKEARESTLWLHGIPGCGKTILCSRIVDDLMEHCIRAPESIALAYFYFDFSQPSKQAFENALRSIVFQLSRQSSAAWQMLTNFIENCENDGMRLMSLSVSLLLNLLRTTIGVFDKAYIVLDALDEALEHESDLYLVQELPKLRPGKLNLLLTSREERNIQRSLDSSGACDITIGPSLVEQDIHQHIKDRLAQDRSLKRWPEGLRLEIEAELMKGARGMFRWVDCQLDSLRKCLKPSSLRKTLGSLPRTLNESYSNIIKRIDEDYVGEACTIFQWLTYSGRVLLLKEVAEVLAIDHDGGPAFSPHSRLVDARDILIICSSLINITPLGPDSSVIEVRLAHASVRDFLVGGEADFGGYRDSSFDPKFVHERIAQACLAYLIHLGSYEESGMAIEEAFPLAGYAARHWMLHAAAGTQSPEVHGLAMKLLQRDSLGYQRLLQLHDVDRVWRETSPIYESTLPAERASVPPLYYATLTGLADVVRSLLERGESPCEKAGLFGYPLTAATFRGREDIVRELLKHGADPNASRGILFTPLVAASVAGHEKLVRLLLEKGADPSGGHYRMGNTLMAAVQNGQEGIVDLLIQHGVDVDKRVGKGPRPLELAIRLGHETIVKQLLRGAAKCGPGDIELAARNSQASILKALMSHKASLERKQEDEDSVNTSTTADIVQTGEAFGQYKVSLATAAAGGLEDIVRQLLDSGIDVNSTNGAGTALSEAASEGHLSIAKLLLQRGADIDNSGSYGTPLQYAAYRGHLSLVRLLLNAVPAPDINAAEGHFSHPLQAAAVSGNLAVVEEILSRDPQINAASDPNGTALAAAAIDGHEKMAQLLLDRGADVNLVCYQAGRGRSYSTPLANAVSAGDATMIQLLLRSGADVNLASGRDNRTPLAIAVRQKSVATIKLLFDNGASSVDKHALQDAVMYYGDNRDVIRLLLQRGIDADARIVDEDSSSTSCGTAKTLDDANQPSVAYTFALQLAAKIGQVAYIGELLRNGAVINRKDSRGFTALHEAAQAGCESACRTLIDDFDADMSATLLNGSLPIHLAAQYGNDPCVRLFLTKGVDINTTNDENRTPLHTAADNGRVDTVRLLKAEGADLGRLDQHQMTALDLAHFQLDSPGRSWMKKDYRAIVEALLGDATQLVSQELT